MFNDIYKNKTVIVTGHTGFKGSWLSLWLQTLGANVVGFSKNIPTNPSNYCASNIKNLIEDVRGDILDQNKFFDVVKTHKPDYIFHLAAQALVKESYINPIETWQTNTIGTLNVLDAVRKLKLETKIISITSDKCYDNVEWLWGYRETDRLGGPDPYSASKGAAELVISSYYRSFFESSGTKLVSARAGNVIGGGDWAIDRILPDCIKAWNDGETVNLRKPNATRPWQHVLEPLSGYLTLGEKLFYSKNINGESYNFGPNADNTQSVMDLVQELAGYWKNAKFEDISEGYIGPYESGLLKLNCDKALHDLSWKASLNFKDTVRLSAEWYSLFYENTESDMSQVCFNQIQEYSQIASDKNILWSK